MSNHIAKQVLDLWAWIKRRTAVLERPVVRRIALVGATVLFAGGLWFAYQSRPHIFDELNPTAWAGVFVLVPVTLAINALVFWLTARIGKIPISLSRALVVTVLSTAANLLPLPGGAAVRTVALSEGGKAYGSALKLTLLTGLTWMGLASGVCATGLLLLSYIEYGLLAGVLSVSALSVALMGLKGSIGAGVSRLVALLAAQLLLAATGGFRLLFCFHALGEVVLLEQVLVLLFAPVVSAFVGIAPGGLGLTELTAAGLAALIGFVPATAFVAAALNRITGLLVVTPLAVVLNVLNVTYDRDKGRGDLPSESGR